MDHRSLIVHNPNVRQPYGEMPWGVLIKYSLVNGDIELNYRNDKCDVQVEVILVDEDHRKHSLNNRSHVKAKDSLRFIKNTMHYPVVVVKPGKYKGELIIHHESTVEIRKCCIQVLNKELEEK